MCKGHSAQRCGVSVLYGIIDLKSIRRAGLRGVFHSGPYEIFAACTAGSLRGL